MDSRLCCRGMREEMKFSMMWEVGAEGGYESWEKLAQFLILHSLKTTEHFLIVWREAADR